MPVKARGQDRPRLFAMTLKTELRRRRIAGIAWRFFWQSVAGLVIFAQVAVAADLCLPGHSGGEHQDRLVAVATAPHNLDSHCAIDLLRAKQAPASEAKRLSPDIGLPAPDTWRSAPNAALLPESHPPARAGPSFRVRFRNFRL